MDAILGLDATGQLAALAAKRISAEELLAATIRQYEAVNAPLNAVVATDLARAKERARAIDDHRVKGDALGPLAGLPMTIKDTFDVEGMPASAGLDQYRHGKRPDAVVVSHARTAGAVVWGKTNVPVLAGDFQTFNDVYGVTNNPWDLTRTPGGSSGGAAAALATHMTALEIGSDIGGSLRTPASFCGVYSHKPTWGLVSQLGHVPPKPGSLAERDLNVVGPMARSARDLRLLLTVIEGATPSPGMHALPELESLRIGVWLDEPAYPLDPEVRTVLEAFAKELEGAGAHVASVVSPVDAGALLAAYRTLLASTLAADMPPAQLGQMKALGGVSRLALRLGADPESLLGLPAAYVSTHLEWMAADEARARVAAQARRLFAQYDVILAPLTPVAAFPHDPTPIPTRKLTFSTGEKHGCLIMLRWIALATACGLPATAIPAGQTRAGLPVGAQLIGPRGADAKTIAIAEAIEARLGGFTAPPKAATS
ncbi:MAG TPA: amidase family protein [Caulobacteraceae bacterium]|jgi:amidase